MTRKLSKFRRLIVLLIILTTLLFNFAILNTINNDEKSSQNKNNENQYPLSSNEIYPILEENNEFIGIGAPWNVSHYANTSKTDTASFSNNSYSELTIEPADDWIGYKLNASIRDLYDERQWVNGTMHYGDGDGIDSVDGNDDSITTSWDFTKNDDTTDFTNTMSGNYINDTSPISDNNDCLELRMDGNYDPPGSMGDRWRYDPGDECYWTYQVTIPRGKVKNSEFKFDLKPVHIADAGNFWTIRIAINDQEILYYDIINLNDIGEGNWGHKEAIQRDWINSDVFDDPIGSVATEIKITLDYTGGDPGVSHGDEDGPDVNYQQILIDNVELNIQAEVAPTQVDLKLNNTYQVYNGTDYGMGTAEISGGNWNGTELDVIKANFSSIGEGLYGGYHLDFIVDLNLFSKKENSVTYYEQDPSSQGTSFTVQNNSLVEWEAYSFVNVPDGYEQNEMKVYFPTDYQITWVSKMTDPENDRKNDCTIGNGNLTIPTNLISNPNPPDGFWKFKAESPNYCENLNLYRNTTANPSGTDWTLDTSFIAGDYINITANIRYDPLITNYIHLTQAKLQIRFPNGSIWTAKNNYSNPDAPNGLVRFEKIRIPKDLGYDYQVGEYEAIVTWNNSFSNSNLNETGLIYKNFTVIHESTLTTENSIYMIEDVNDDDTINLKMNFNDKIDRTAIKYGEVYTTDFNDNKADFDEIQSDLYLLVLDLSDANAGNNTLTIYGNHSYFINNKINVTIEVTKLTLLSVESTFVSIPQYQNFSILFNYTLKNSPDTGIDATELTTDWEPGNYSFNKIGQGQYNLTCNTSSYVAYNLYTLLLTVKNESYESQVIPINIYITGLSSSLELLVNDTSTDVQNLFQIEIFQSLNITARFRGPLDDHLGGANVSLVGFGNMTEQNEQFSITINATQLGDGINSLNVFANKTGYNPQAGQFYVSVIEKPTIIQVWLNGINKTLDPSITLPITGPLEIKVVYNDTDGNYVDDAIVNLFSGETLLKVLNENKVNKYYSTSINTGQLGLGLTTLSIDANKPNYQPQVENLRNTVRKIRTGIDTEDGEDDYDIRPGESFKLTIEITDLDFGGKIEDAEVTYDAKFGSGDLEEVDDGVYEVVLENIEEGSYTIDIYVAKEGGLYEFKDFKVSLTVETPEGEAMLFIIAFIIAASVSGSLATYFIVYRYWLQYPKPVRKIRKYRRTLKRKKSPYTVTDISSREKSFGKLFKEHTSGLVKSKISQKTPDLDKLTKKSIEGPSEEAK